MVKKINFKEEQLKELSNTLETLLHPTLDDKVKK